MEEFLKSVHNGLGPEWENWCASIMHGEKRHLIFGPQERDEEWTCHAAYGRGIRETGRRAVGIYIEPASFTYDLKPEEGMLLEIAAFIPIGGKDRRPVPGNHTHYARGLAARLQEEFPEVGGYDIVGRYPNRHPRRTGGVFISVDGRGPDQANAHTTDEEIICPTSVWVSIPFRLDPGAFDGCPLNDLQAFVELKHSLPLFKRIIEFVRGAVGDAIPKSIDQNCLLGWCGEYAWWARHGHDMNADWRGGYEFPYDFSTAGRTVEIKSSRDVPPNQPLFSINELRYAAKNPDTYDLVSVGIKSDFFWELLSIANESLQGGTGAPLGPEQWMLTLERDVGVPVSSLPGLLSKLLPCLERISATAVFVTRPAVFAGVEFGSSIRALTGATVPRIIHGKVAVEVGGPEGREPLPI